MPDKSRRDTQHAKRDVVLDRIARRFEQLDAGLAELEESLQRTEAARRRDSQTDDQDDKFRPANPR